MKAELVDYDSSGRGSRRPESFDRDGRKRKAGLKAKIALGFALICVIFVAVGLLIGFELLKVQADTDNINENLMPGNDLSSSLQFNISRESLMVANFNNSGQKEMWDNAL
ncbi:MAG: hypothetical protein LBE49_04660, partial [Deltaproteobacteria bacterium]|nr:hypothetical protein [Deltaproteobacteria bacterium]